MQRFDMSVERKKVGSRRTSMRGIELSAGTIR
jgi:hypothetical protein